MNKFIAAIELYNANEKDYQTLNAELEREPFKKNKKASAKGKARLPQKEYTLETNAGLQQVSEALRKAAEKTGKKYSFTVIKNKPIYN